MCQAGKEEGRTGNCIAKNTQMPEAPAMLGLNEKKEAMAAPRYGREEGLL